ncbi:MAG: hypothetical protein ABSF98_04270 [Bryobacteraceae bacterium]|jgi:hypothetical protein
MFFQKVRQLEKEIAGLHAVVVSSETPDGGRPGQTSEVATAVAARMIVEGKARLATPEERTQYQASVARGIEAAKRRELMGKAQVRLLSDADIETLRSALRPAKGS